MKRTQEEAEQTRSDLLEAALVVFSRKGFEATTLSEIAAEASVTRGAIYHHFGSKEDFYLALIDDASTHSNMAIQRAIAEGGEFLAIVKRIIVYTLTLLEENVRFRQVMALSLRFDVLPQLVDRRYQEAEQLVESVSQSFQMGKQQGQIRSNLSPASAARALIAYQNGLALLWLANKDAFSIKAEAEELAMILLYGVAA